MQEIIPKIQEAFHVAFDIDPHLVTIETTPDQISGWDSMGHVALASSLERIFKLNFDVDELMEMEDVRNIVRIIQTKLEKS